MNDHDTRMAWLKVFVAWVLTAIGGVTLQQVATVLAIVYTALQIFLLLRDRVVKKRVAADSKRGDLDEPA